MSDLVCEPLAPFQRKLFWTTQPDGCGVMESCDTDCARAGLELVEQETGSSFVTTDWIRSLALNILLTDQRREATTCGHRPGTMNGHWSESFMEDGAPVGTKVRYISFAASIIEVTQLIKAELQNALTKLIKYGIAVSVTVEAEYLGKGIIKVDVEILSVHGQTARVGMTAQRTNNTWAWI